MEGRAETPWRLTRSLLTARATAEERRGEESASAASEKEIPPSPLEEEGEEDEEAEEEEAGLARRNVWIAAKRFVGRRFMTAREGSEES